MVQLVRCAGEATGAVQVHGKGGMLEWVSHVHAEAD